MCFYQPKFVSAMIARSLAWTQNSGMLQTSCGCPIGDKVIHPSALTSIKASQAKKHFILTPVLILYHNHRHYYYYHHQHKSFNPRVPLFRPALRTRSCVSIVQQILPLRKSTSIQYLNWLFNHWPSQYCKHQSHDDRSRIMSATAHPRNGKNGTKKEKVRVGNTMCSSGKYYVQWLTFHKQSSQVPWDQ